MEFSSIEMIIRVALVLLASFVLTVGTVIVVKWLRIDIKNPAQRTGSKFMSIALAANLLFILAVYLLLKLIDHQSIQVIGLSFSNKDIIFSVMAMLITFMVSAGFIYSFKRGSNYEIQWAPQLFIKKDAGPSFLLSLLVLFVAALQEEVMFRGYLSFVFQELHFVNALLLSTMIFTVWHFIGNRVTFYQTVDWFAGGVLLYYVFTVSGSIWVAAFVHFSRNLANVIFWNIADKHSLFQWKQPLSPKHKTIYILTVSTAMGIISNLFY